MTMPQGFLERKGVSQILVYEEEPLHGGVQFKEKIERDEETKTT